MCSSGDKNVDGRKINHFFVCICWYGWNFGGFSCKIHGKDASLCSTAYIVAFEWSNDERFHSWINSSLLSHYHA